MLSNTLSTPVSNKGKPKSIIKDSANKDLMLIQDKPLWRLASPGVSILGKGKRPSSGNN